jgi:hypothetical protein
VRLGNLDQVASLREQLLFAAVVLALVVVFFRVAYAPLASQVEVRRARVQGLVLERDALVRFSRTTPVVSRGGSDVAHGAKMRLITGAVRPTFRLLSDLLSEVSHPNFLGGVEVRSLSYLAPAKDEGYERTDFSLKVAGGFSQVIRYLERLENFPALFHIQDLSMDSGEGLAELQAVIGGRFYTVGASMTTGVASTQSAGTGVAP